jgi:uncharacterized protein (TIGR02246 family)
MRKTLIIVGILALCLLGLAVRSGDGQAPVPAADDKAIQQAIQQSVTAYADAVNKGNLAALSAFWAPDADYIDEKGTVTKGRDAITALFKQFLADLKGSKIAFKVTSIRPLTADVAMQDGMSVITRPDGSVDEGHFTAVWFKKDGKWMLRSARDLPHEAAEAIGSGGALKEMQWMIGDWEGDKGRVRVSVRWTLNRAFLSTEYTVKESDGEMQVTQLIGYDPLTGQIKSWTFDSHGGYGEGLWTRQGNSWVVETVGVLPNGQTGKAVNVIRYVDDQNVVFQARDRDVGGQPIPDSETKLMRTIVKK